MPGNMLRIALAALALSLVVPLPACAQAFREYLDSIDLNDYSLGINFYTSQSHYAGVDDFKIVYPMPTSFSHSLLTEDPLFVRGSSAGLRKVTDNGWTFGVHGKLQTLGYGADTSEELRGMRRRTWTVQAGLLLGYAIGPFHVDLFTSTDVLSEHDGYDASLKLAWPIASAKQIFVPEIDLTYQSKDLLDHYFGVRSEEALPDRPAYVPGSGVTISGSLEWRRSLHRRWFLFSKISLDLLPDAITDSPIVDLEQGWRFNLGVAYDGSSFIDPDEDSGTPATTMEIGLGVFYVSATSNLDFLDSGGHPGDLERRQGLDERSVSLPVDIVWRIGRFHRVDVSYFELNRSASVNLTGEMVLNGVPFADGERVVTDLETRVFRFGYGFSLMRDNQKDISLFGGLHATEMDYRVRGAAEPIVASTTSFLPVIGARANVVPAERWSVTGNIEIFLLDFDRHSGELMDIAVSGEYRLTDRLIAGIGYRYYRQDIESGDDSFLGDYRLHYQGPYLNLRARF